ncbi:MAG: MtnX-like HAD-IB family phosphatase [Candidatus Heimdallarchaeota archaeon]|nr:MtnX-like HAD-IB family phosphatase [Candidatus Heimdallarchaeota archaeon]
MKDKIVIAFDFDGTITTNDVVIDLVTLMDEDWKRFQRLMHKGEMSLRERIYRELELITITQKEYYQYIAELMKLDKGAINLFKWIREQDIEIHFISDGLKGVIRYAMETLSLGDGIRYTIDAHELIWEEDGMKIKLADDSCEHEYCANCKPSKVQALKDGRKIVYVGDGRSDVYAAPYADIIFARRGLTLDRFLTEQERDHYVFDDLSQVRDELITLDSKI